MTYKTAVKHDGRTYALEIPDLEIPQCRSCRHLVTSHAVDDEVLQALRRLIRLLTPQQIRERREALGLSGTKLAQCLGVAQETISRWETAALIQSRAMDNLMRVYFAFPEVRAVLQGPDQDPNLGLDGGAIDANEMVQREVSMEIIVFDGHDHAHADEAYLAWCEDHPRGYVINVGRNLKFSYTRLHRAKCHWMRNLISTAQQGGFTERRAVKICSVNKSALREWARQHGCRKDPEDASCCNPS
jgi:putative zinc finger/helix-turn-helix YgiT family protein